MKEEGGPSKKARKGMSAPKLKVEDALEYLAKVKCEFDGADGKTHIYSRFLDIMKNFKSGHIDTSAVIEQVTTLFDGHDHLILGFNTFLPEDQKIQPESLVKNKKKRKLANTAGSDAAAGGSHGESGAAGAREWRFCWWGGWRQ